MVKAVVETKSIELIKKFAEDIEQIVVSKECNYIDAIILYCEENNIEMENIASLIKSNPVIKQKIQVNAEELNYLPKISRLPV